MGSKWIIMIPWSSSKDTPQPPLDQLNQQTLHLRVCWLNHCWITFLSTSLTSLFHVAKPIMSHSQEVMVVGSWLHPHGPMATQLLHPHGYTNPEPRADGDRSPHPGRRSSPKPQTFFSPEILQNNMRIHGFKKKNQYMTEKHDDMGPMGHPFSWGIFLGSQSWGAEPGLPVDGTLEDTWARKWLGKLWKTMENPRKFGDSISFLFRQMSNQILSLTSFKWQEMLYDYPGEIGNDQQGDIIKNLRKLNTTVWISWKRLIFLTMKNAHSHPCINNCLSTELCSPVQG